MSTVLLIDDDPEIIDVVRTTLDEDGHDVLVSSGGTSALRALTETQIDVLLLDAEAERHQEHSLLEMAVSAARPVATVMMISEATARRAERALDGGASGVLDKPFSEQELRRAVARAVEGESFRGRLNGLSVLDMFQVFNLSRRSLVAVLGTQPEARVWFDKGEVVHAERGEAEGEAVLDTLLEVRTGAIRTLPFAITRRSVHRPFHSLLLDLLRTRDETSQDLDVTLDVEERDFLGLGSELTSGSGEGDGMREGSPAEDAVTALPQRRFDPLCVAMTAEIPEALAVALIELSSGLLLGLSNSASFSPEFERFIALFTRSLFRGPEVRHIEDTLSEQRGVLVAEGFVEEFVVTSRHTHHLAKVIAEGQVALMVVTPRRTAVEATWTSIREMLPVIERNLC
ncbi:MAG: response regulator [Myxococcota bacterium]